MNRTKAPPSYRKPSRSLVLRETGCTGACGAGTPACCRKEAQVVCRASGCPCRRRLGTVALWHLSSCHATSYTTTCVTYRQVYDVKERGSVLIKSVFYKLVQTQPSPRCRAGTPLVGGRPGLRAEPMGKAGSRPRALREPHAARRPQGRRRRSPPWLYSSSSSSSSSPSDREVQGRIWR